MAIVRWDPFAELNALHDQLNTIFNDNLSPMRNSQVAPVTDVYSEDNKQMTVEVHLPNFKEEEVDISVHDGSLEIKAEHHEKEESNKKRQYLVRESSSSFYRRVALPKQSNEDEVKAHFEDGVLKVVVPFKELPQPKKIAIHGKKQK